MAAEQHGQNPQSGGGKCSLKQIVGFRNLENGRNSDSWSLSDEIECWGHSLSKPLQFCLV